jgi:SNF2 family DNA or RNA helicase
LFYDFSTFEKTLIQFIDVNPLLNDFNEKVSTGLLTCRSKTFGLKRYKNNRSFIKTFGNRTEIISEVDLDKEQNNFIKTFTER